MGELSTLTNYIVPLLICGILVYGLTHRVNVFETFVGGAKEGLFVAVRIVPSLVALMTAVGMFKASGALDMFSHLIAPVAQLLHFPAQIIPMAMLRPISGSGAMVLLRDLLSTFGPDSYIGRVASVLEGSAETTFYTMAVYFGATHVSRTRHTLPAALLADLVGFIMSAITVQIFFGR